MKVKKKYYIWTLLVILFFVSGPIPFAYADIDISELPGALDKVSLGFDTHLFYRVDENPYFGAVLAGDEEDTAYGEIFTRFKITGEKTFDWAKVEAQVAPYFTSTVGQDFYGMTKDKDELKMNQAFLKFHNFCDSPFDITLGRQDIQIEKWFVIADGELQPAAQWLAWHYSFPFAARVDGTFGNFSTTFFWARSNDYYQNWDAGIKDDVEVSGINFHYDISDGFYIYGGFYRKFDNSGLIVSSYTPLNKDLLYESDTEVWDLGVELNIGNLKFEAEGVVQSGDAGTFIDGADRDRDAFGGFSALTYQFSNRYNPFIRFSYNYFSGDEDPEDDDAEEYDPMFSQFAAWNRWVIGELTGEAHLPNSNKKVFGTEIGFSPKKSITCTFMYLNHELDEKYWLTPSLTTSSTDWADEFNFLVDWQVNELLYVHLGFGYIVPNDAAEDAFSASTETGSIPDDDALFGQALASFSL